MIPSGDTVRFFRGVAARGAGVFLCSGCVGIPGMEPIASAASAKADPARVAPGGSSQTSELPPRRHDGMELAISAANINLSQGVNHRHPGGTERRRRTRIRLRHVGIAIAVLSLLVVTAVLIRAFA